MTTNNPIDLEILAKLQELDDENNSFVIELFTLYLNNIPPNIQKIKESFSNGKFQEVSKVAHQMKSSSGNIGAMYISKLCSTLEDFDMSKDTKGAEALIQSIEAAFTAVRDCYENKIFPSLQKKK